MVGRMILVGAQARVGHGAAQHRIGPGRSMVASVTQRSAIGVVECMERRAHRRERGWHVRTRHSLPLADHPSGKALGPERRCEGGLVETEPTDRDRGEHSGIHPNPGERPARH